MFWPFGRILLLKLRISRTDFGFVPAWGLTMAAFKVNLPLASYGFEIVKCFMGAFILRSSACTVNDIIDRNMDAGVGMDCCILIYLEELTSSCPRTYTT